MVNKDTGVGQQATTPIDGSLTAWVMDRVSGWEDHRKQNYDAKWDEYYRLWRGIWNTTDKSRDSERSKIINPALSQAIEAAVAEIEEASFGSGKYFDVSDDYIDEEEADVQMWRDQMEEDMDKEDVPSAVSETFLNGAIYGTGIAKLVLREVTDKRIVAAKIGESDITTPQVQHDQTIRVGLLPVHPKEFVIDPSARTINEALGCAHITTVPRHTIQAKQADGTYKSTPVGAYAEGSVGTNSTRGFTDDDLTTIKNDDRTLLIEYHGFVPRELLHPVVDEVVSIFPSDAPKVEVDDTDLVEAIVTIANGSILLRAVENPYLMGDRCFIAYQHDTVPNRFWGRGVAEKGYNPQKALDAESRGRIDAMALSIHPMMAMDATRMQRGQDWKVAPGRNVLTNGNPRDILMPFNFGQVNPTTFNQTGDLERQVQTGTGSMDSASPLSQNRRNETSGGMSMIMGGVMKRTKRTLANIERTFMKPLVNKSAWRYMQFAPDRYPAADITFNVHSTVGIMAREMEQQQLANLLNTVPPESPAFWMLLKGIFAHSTMSDREEMLEIIEDMMESSLEKQQKPEPDPFVAVKMEELKMDQQEAQVKAQLEQAKHASSVDKDNKQLQLEVKKLQLEEAKLALKREEVILKAKLEKAAQAQDSVVTAMQMSVKQLEAQGKESKERESRAASAPSAPQVIQMAPPEKKTKKRMTVKRTATGLEGSVEEVQDESERKIVKVVRTGDTLEGTVE